jgi:guanine deaminase
MQVIHGGRVLRPETLDCSVADIVVEGDTIREIVAPGTVKDANAQRIDAADRVLIPGLVNGHNHAQTGLAKGLFDRYTLELYLNAVPWATGRRTLEDKYLSAVIGAAEMVRKGCTSAYDMFAEFPLPTVDGVNAVARAYADVGMRASVATMMADRSFYEAIPGMLDAMPAAARELAMKVKYAPHEQAIAACRAIVKDWTFDRAQVRPALGPTIPHHCTDAFLTASRDLAKEYGLGMQMHVAESRPQAVVAQTLYGKSLVAHLDALGMLGPHFCVSHGVWLDADDQQRLADRGASLSHNPAATSSWARASPIFAACSIGGSTSRSAPMARRRRTTSTCSRRCAWPRISPACRATRSSAGCPRARRSARPPKAVPRRWASRRSGALRPAGRPTSYSSIWPRCTTCRSTTSCSSSCSRRTAPAWTA